MVAVEEDSEVVIEEDSEVVIEEDSEEEEEVEEDLLLALKIKPEKKELSPVLKEPENSFDHFIIFIKFIFIYLKIRSKLQVINFFISNNFLI